MIVWNEIAGFVLPIFIYSFSGGVHFEFGGEGVAPAAVFIAQVTDGDTGDTDGAVGFGKLGQALVDGVGEDGPEVFFGGGIVRVRLRVGGTRITL